MAGDQRPGILARRMRFSRTLAEVAGLRRDAEDQRDQRGPRRRRVAEPAPRQRQPASPAAARPPAAPDQVLPGEIRGASSRPADQPAGEIGADVARPDHDSRTNSTFARPAAGRSRARPAPPRRAGYRPAAAHLRRGRPPAPQPQPLRDEPECDHVTRARHAQPPSHQPPSARAARTMAEAARRPQIRPACGRSRARPRSAGAGTETALAAGEFAQGLRRNAARPKSGQSTSRNSSSA